MTRERLVPCPIELAIEGINENRRPDDLFTLNQVNEYMSALAEEPNKAYLLDGNIHIR